MMVLACSTTLSVAACGFHGMKSSQAIAASPRRCLLFALTRLDRFGDCFGQGCGLAFVNVRRDDLGYLFDAVGLEIEQRAARSFELGFQRLDLCPGCLQLLTQ